MGSEIRTVYYKSPSCNLLTLTSQPGFPIYTHIISLLNVGSLRKYLLYFLLKIIKKQNKKKKQHINSIICYTVYLWRTVVIFHMKWACHSVASGSILIPLNVTSNSHYIENTKVTAAVGPAAKPKPIKRIGFH